MFHWKRPLKNSRPRRALALMLGLALAGTLTPLGAQLARQEKASVALETSHTAFAPGQDAEILIVLEIDAGWHTNSHDPTYDYLIATEVEVDVPEGWESPDLVYPPGEMKSFAFAEEAISVYEGSVAIVARLGVPEAAAEGVVEVGVHLTYQACDDRSCLPPVTTTSTIELTIGDQGQANPTAIALDSEGGVTSEDPGAAGPGIAWMLLLGLLGGLILNAMPCVLPVLSLKVFGMIKSAEQGRAEVVRGALATSAGILVSFWALALLAVLAKSGGNAVGWGIQFQEPLFVAALTIIVVLFCLNLWGIFEITLPGRVTTAAGTTTADGVAGHFTSGLFATLMATPCSAPFLGTAVGFGLSQSAPTILAIFTSVGIGMALPYLTLAVAPGAAKHLPKPGAWMTHVRVVMGFLLAGAAVWLLYVLSAQVSPERLAFFEIALLAMAMLVWWRQRGTTRAGSRAVVSLGVVASIVLAMVLVRGNEATANVPRETVDRLIDWSRFDRAEAERLAGDGRLVFVDVTADWCFTCKVNERLALETVEVADAFARHGVVAMKADWTNRDDAIAAFLADHGRYGIPFYLLYRPGEQPHLFGELITTGEIIGVLEAAASGALASLD